VKVAQHHNCHWLVKHAAAAQIPTFQPKICSTVILPCSSRSVDLSSAPSLPVPGRPDPMLKNTLSRLPIRYSSKTASLLTCEISWSKELGRRGEGFNGPFLAEIRVEERQVGHGRHDSLPNQWRAYDRRGFHGHLAHDSFSTSCM
jgi:hypothetical protein